VSNTLSTITERPIYNLNQMSLDIVKYLTLIQCRTKLDLARDIIEVMSVFIGTPSHSAEHWLLTLHFRLVTYIEYRKVLTPKSGKLFNFINCHNISRGTMCKNSCSEKTPKRLHERVSG
jgi:hypothetical protein